MDKPTGRAATGWSSTPVSPFASWEHSPVVSHVVMDSAGVILGLHRSARPIRACSRRSAEILRFGTINAAAVNQYHMKIAVSGKGGVGKTVVTGTLARTFAADGYDVLAIDGDHDPDLAVSLGMGHETEAPPVPDEFLEHVETPDDEPPEWELTRPSEEIVDEYGVAAPGGVTLLRAGEISADEGAFGYSHVTVLNVLRDIETDSDEVVILDMAAGLGAPGMCKAVDAYVMVVEPTYNSLETVRKLNEYATAYDVPDVRVIANNVRRNGDVAYVSDFCEEEGLDVSTVVPSDDAIREAERAGTAVFDYDGESPALQVIRGMAADIGASHGASASQQNPSD